MRSRVLLSCFLSLNLFIISCLNSSLTLKRSGSHLDFELPVSDTELNEGEYSFKEFQTLLDTASDVNGDGEIAIKLGRNVRIIDKNIHFQRSSSVGNDSSNIAKTYDAQCFSIYFSPHKIRSFPLPI